jgi:hypothetical protein
VVADPSRPTLRSVTSAANACTVSASGTFGSSMSAIPPPAPRLRRQRPSISSLIPSWVPLTPERVVVGVQERERSRLIDHRAEQVRA